METQPRSRKQLTRSLTAVALVLTLVFALQPTGLARAALITVTTTTDAIAADGNCSLREAIRAANLNSAVNECSAGSGIATDTITLVNGAVYNLAIGGASEDMALTGDLDIAGNTATVDLILNVAGGGTAIVNAGAISDRVMHVLGNATVQIIGVGIGGGSGVANGGGVYNSGTLTLDGSAVGLNTATGSGGGVYNGVNGTANIVNGSIIGGEDTGNSAANGGGIYNETPGTVTISDSAVSANTATFSTTGTGYGGGVYTKGMLIVLDGSTIGGAGVGNSAESGTPGNGYGGGIYNAGTGSVTINASTVSANTADGAGGGIRNDGDLTIMNDSVIGGAGSGNSAPTAGGIYNPYGSTTVDNSTVSWNSATGGEGGGIYNRATLTIQNGSVIGGPVGLGNWAVGEGGGIYSSSAGTVIVDASAIGDNGAHQRGGGVSNQGTLTVQNGSFIGEPLVGGNYSDSEGGGISNGSSGVATIDNSTIGGNFAFMRGGGIYNLGELTIQSGSSIGGPGAGNLTNFEGGGVVNETGGSATVTGSILVENTAGLAGGAIWNDELAANNVVVTGSCIVGNSGVAFHNNQPGWQDATGNWWGAIDGPGPIGTGHGDTVGKYVDYSGFLRAPILGCPTTTWLIYLPAILRGG